MMNIVILTGAGISAESGIDTFRDNGGLWEHYPIEQVATPQGYAADPALVQTFYNLRRAALKTVFPNPAHTALGALQEELVANGGRLTIVTQNVDDLHERGGARGVIHMHGQLTSVKCSVCTHRWDWYEDVTIDSRCIACQTRGGPRPDIVWFGEMPYEMDRIEACIKECDLFVSIGTSGAVYPAAGFVQMARAMHVDTLELNLEPSDGSHHFHSVQYGKAGTLVPLWCETIKDNLSKV